jgi:hypothetical protein
MLKQLTKKEKQSIEIEKDARAEKQALQEKINAAITEFANTAIYTGKSPDSMVVRQAMEQFSDFLLKMPYDMYRNIALVTDSRYTFQQMDCIMQIVSLPSAFQMGMGIAEYIAYKDELQVIMGGFAESLEAEKQRIKDSFVVPVDVA